jgi:hypothetical protein
VGLSAAGLGTGSSGSAAASGAGAREPGAGSQPITQHRFTRNSRSRSRHTIVGYTTAPTLCRQGQAHTLPAVERKRETQLTRIGNAVGSHIQSPTSRVIYASVCTAGFAIGWAIIRIFDYHRYGHGPMMSHVASHFKIWLVVGAPIMFAYAAIVGADPSRRRRLSALLLQPFNSSRINHTPINRR